MTRARAATVTAIVRGVGVAAVPTASLVPLASRLRPLARQRDIGSRVIEPNAKTVASGGPYALVHFASSSPIRYYEVMTDTTPPTRRRWFQFGFGTLFVLIPALSCWLAWEIHFSSFDWRGVQRRLESRVASGAPTIDFAAETSFAWDRLFIFHCYSSQANVEKALGFRWPGFRHATIDLSDSVHLVVFMNEGGIAYWYEQPRTIDMSEIANEVGYLRTDAKFSIERTDWVRLVPLSAPKRESKVN
jgi:hypothetical protein